jgi:hypothetical protein
MGFWQGIRALDAAERRLLVEAITLLGFAWIGLRIFSFPVLRRVFDAYSRKLRRASRAAPSPKQIAWAVTKAGGKFPWRITCVMEALAADAMLRRHGYMCEIRLGVRPPGHRPVPLQAHAWVECEGAVVVGAIDDLADYAPLSAPTRS